MDSVAKIILSDWVRGRIPFFVPPPERPEALNKAEEKAKKIKAKNDTKDKSQVVDVDETGEAEENRPGVKQNLGSIMQKNKFLAEDIQPLEEEFAEVSVDDEEKESDDDSGDEAGGVNDGEEEELTWNDVFTGIHHDEMPEGAQGRQIVYFCFYCTVNSTMSTGSTSGNDAEEDEEGEEAAPGKEPRMRTNKVHNQSVLFKTQVGLTDSSHAAQSHELLFDRQREKQKSR